MKPIIKSILGCALVTIVVTACEPFTCPINNIVEAHFTFYQASREKETGTFTPGGAVQILDTLTITACGTDSVLLNKKTGASSLALPVSYYHAADTLVFSITDTLQRTSKDTIYMSKTNVPHFDDPSCPANMYHEITEIQFSRHFIDTVIINSPSINYDALENLQIYLK